MIEKTPHFARVFGLNVFLITHVCEREAMDHLLLILTRKGFVHLKCFGCFFDTFCGNFAFRDFGFARINARQCSHALHFGLQFGDLLKLQIGLS